MATFAIWGEEFEILYGHFLSHKVKMLRTDGKGYIEVMKLEEKMSDVNLASHLLFDAFNDKYNLAVLVSNDSDFKEPLSIVVEKMDKKVGILNPQKIKLAGLYLLWSYLLSK